MPELHDAVFAGNIEKLKCFVDEGEDINAKNENGLKPLDIAIMKNDIEIVKFLLSDTFKDKIVIDMNVWLQAIRVQDDTITSCLLNNFEPTILKVEDSQGLKLVHHTVIYRYVDMLCFLIKKNVDINSVTLNGYTPLHFAVIQNDRNIMKILLDNGAEVCTKTVSGSNVIHLALKHWSIKCLYRLLEHSKINLNDPITSTGLTALGIAVEKCDKNIVEKLIRSGATLDCKDNNDRNLLHIAVEQGNEDLVKLFLQKGIDVNAITKEKCTPLEIALTRRNEGIVKIILDYNPDVMIKNKDGLCPLFTAIKYRCCSIELFSLQSDLNVVTNDNSSILHYALQFNDDYIIHNLLEEDISFTQNIFGEHPLHIACQYCTEEIVSKILNNKINVNLRTVDGSTPLHYAIKYYRTYNVPLLLNYGADINAENNKKETPLHFAVKIRSLPIFVEMLLKNGADPNHIADDKTTPLHWALVGSYKEITELLIKYGANVNKLNGNDDNCLHLGFKYTCCSFRHSFLDLSIKNGVDVNGLNKDDETPLELFIQNTNCNVCDIHSINFLIKAGAIIRKNKFNETLTHTAIKYSNDSIIEYFLNIESEISAQTYDGQSLLHYAVKYYSKKEYESFSFEYRLKKTIDLLLVKTKNMINSRNNKGQTPLHVAVSRGFIKIVDKLLNNEADINAKDKKKYTPLHYAIEAENMEMTKFLLKKGASLNHDASIFDLAAKIKNQHIYKILLMYYIDH